MSKRPEYTADLASQGVQEAISIIEGRWKLVILFQLFGGRVMRFSELERAIPAISQKMLAQQLRQLERDGVVVRTIHNEVPPRVEYRLTAWGQSLCPALDALLLWNEGAAAAARLSSGELLGEEGAPALSAAPAVGIVPKVVSPAG